MAPLVGHKGKVGRLGNISQPHIVAAMDNFKIHMAKIAPEVEVLDVVDDAGKVIVAEKAATGLIQRYPDLAGVAGFDGSSGSGICPAVKAANKEGKIKIVIDDLTTTHIEFLKDGSAQYVSGQKRNIFGPLALQVLFDINHQGYAFTASTERDADLGIYQAPDPTRYRQERLTVLGRNCIIAASTHTTGSSRCGAACRSGVRDRK